MKVVILQHESTEPAGLFEELFSELGVEYCNIPLFKTNEIPPFDATHLLLMGGAMSVHDEQEFGFLKDEKQLIRKSINANRPILGICLGAQLIADALGGKVTRCQREVGWAPLFRARGDIHHLFPEAFFSFQLHGETFAIPKGGTLLCTGVQVKHQAFSYRSAIGLQFHPEVTGYMINDWTRDLPPEEKESIGADSARYSNANVALCRHITSRFLHQSPPPHTY